MAEKWKPIEGEIEAYRLKMGKRSSRQLTMPIWGVFAGRKLGSLAKIYARNNFAPKTTISESEVG